MINKYLNTLAIIVGVLAAFVISGCTTSPSRVVSSAGSSITIQLDHQYPQMYTPYMLENMDAIEKEHDLTWLGCYDDGQDAFILWHNDNKTGECIGAVLIPGRNVQELPCDEAWLLYLDICAMMGNCQQLI